MLEKENNTVSSDDDVAVRFFSPPPTKNQNFLVQLAPQKKHKKMLRTQAEAHPSHVDPMSYYHKTPSASSTAATTTVLKELPPCTSLLELNFKKKEYLATPRVLLEHF